MLFSLFFHLVGPSHRSSRNPIHTSNIALCANDVDALMVVVCVFVVPGRFPKSRSFCWMGLFLSVALAGSLIKGLAFTFRSLGRSGWWLCAPFPGLVLPWMMDESSKEFHESCDMCLHYLLLFLHAWVESLRIRSFSSIYCYILLLCCHIFYFLVWRSVQSSSTLYACCGCVVCSTNHIR
jgi:hypothetical protein